MKDSETRRLETFIRVRQFGVAHAQTFPANSRGGELITEISTVISLMEGFTSAQDSGKRGAMEGTALVAVAREELREDLEAVRRTARAMSLTTPGLEEKFRLPRKTRDQELLAAARSFAADAAPLKAEFIRRGLPADFVEDLSADADAFAAAIENQAQRSGERVAATAAVDAAIERGADAVKELDAVVRNVFRDDAGVLAEWTSASHTERASRRAAVRTDANATPPPPAHP
ncbi:MAG TPA: hypothetical protein VF538_07710 [Pyrinomonadaceae bacterium]|jgi:hypothetical protein